MCYICEGYKVILDCKFMLIRMCISGLLDREIYVTFMKG